MSLIPTVLRAMRPSNWVEENFRMMKQMDAIMNSAFPIRPTFHIEWKEPWNENTNLVENANKEYKSNTPFRVELNVKNFKPQEISVKTIDNSIIIEGKKEEKTEGGFVSRHFVRTFNLPEGHLAQDVVSSLSADGVLTISAPNKPAICDQERDVPITMENKNAQEKVDASGETKS